MSGCSRKSSAGQLVVGALLVIAGVAALIARLGVPEYWTLVLRNTAQVGAPILLIGAGMLWWVLDAQRKAGGREQ